MINDASFLQAFFVSILYFPLFLTTIFFAFYIPGNVVIDKKLQNFTGLFQKLIICLLVGFVLWAYQGAFFGYLGIRSLTYAYLIIFFCFWLRKQDKRNFFILWKERITRKNIHINYFLFVIFCLGILGQIQQFFISGLILQDGIHIFTAASDDAVFHTSLTAQIVRRFPPFEPGLINVVVHNYHYWSNLVIAELVRVFHLPLLPTQFQYTYILISFLLGGVSYILAKSLRFSSLGVTIFIYMQYFSSDVLYLLTFLTRRVFDFSVGPLEEGTMFLENPPRAFATVVFLGGTIFFIDWVKTKNLRSGFLTALLFGSLVGFKVHTGIPVLAGLGILSLFFLVTRKWKLLLIPFITVLISISIYFPVNKNSGTLFFAPFEMTRNFAVQPNLHISNFELARRIYFDHANFLQVWRMDIIMLVIFLFAEFGIRTLGLLPTKQMLRDMGIPLSLFLYASLIAAFILGTFFYQPFGGSDIFNFYLTGSLILSIFASFILGKLLEKKILFFKICFLSILLVVSVPRWIYKNRSIEYYFSLNTNKPVISSSELSAMEFVRKNTNKEDIILVFNQGQWDSLFPYVSIFTQRDMYLSGQGILARHGIIPKDRLETVERITKTNNLNEITKTLEENNIRILYFYGDPLFKKLIPSKKIRKIFQNNTNTIYFMDKKVQT